MSSYLIGIDGAVHVTGRDGTVSLVPGIPITDLSVLEAALLAGLVSDGETFYAPAIANLNQFIEPALVAADDAIYAPSPARVVQPIELLLDLDSLFQPVTVERLQKPKEQRLRPERFGEGDGFYATTAELKNREMRPALVASDDVLSLNFTTTRFAQAPLTLDADAVPAADVGRQVIAETTTDVDAIYSDISIKLYNDMLPEVWFDEEHIDTYPFFLQQLSGGVPVPPREGVLTGSIVRRVSLTGSIARRRLSGSISGARRLSGSVGPRFAGKKKR